MAMAEDGRIFVRGVSSEDYGLKEFRRRQLAAPRVRDAKGDDHESLYQKGIGLGTTGGNEERGITTWDHIEPGDDPFLTQSLQVYFHDFPPNSSNRGHGHQNEAAFYVIDGKGYEIHDGKRYDWEKGDFYVVHTDSVHRHFNPNAEPATVMIVKAKPMWMFLGLVQQGKSYNPFKEGENPDFGDRVEWGQIWTDGVLDRKKVVGKADAPWENTPLGKVRVFSSPERDDVRMFSVDAFELEIPAGSRSGKSWKMADEILHIVSGSGYSLHWEVEAEIDDKYYAHIAKEPTRHDFKQGDTLYVPQNTITQHFAADGEPLVMFSGQNRVFKHLGYNKIAYLENAPEYEGAAVREEAGVAS
jgi:gentisate 1,2-dioxygenase